MVLRSSHPVFTFQVSHIKTPKQMDEFIEIQSSTGTWYQRWLVRFMTIFKQVCSVSTVLEGRLAPQESIISAGEE